LSPKTHYLLKKKERLRVTVIEESAVTILTHQSILFK
jgi:hypothetical protein